jgi:aminomethyltransferase
MSSTSKRTPLAATHELLGARMMEFGGWHMPVQYQGILQEHKAVREAAGLFDISHMGEVFVSGPGSEVFLNTLLTNDVRKLPVGGGQYTLMLNEGGGVLDDLLCYRIEREHYLLIVNASKIDEDFAWIRSHASHFEPSVQVENQSPLWAGLALQGPKSAAIMQRLFPQIDERGQPSASLLPARNTIVSLPVANGPLLVARTGYTGEDGFECFCSSQSAPFWWDLILKTGEPEGAVPCGLGARDTLRLEAGFPLNGSDLSPEHTPLEAGLGAFVSLQKGKFVGRDSLLTQKETSIPTKLAGLRMDGPTPPPRAHYPVLFNGERVGETCSGSLSPTFGLGIALAYLPSHLAAFGQKVTVDIRGRQFPATVSPRSILKHKP